jgi:hypothetical protein
VPRLATIYQPFFRCPPAALGDLLNHWCHLPLVASRGHDTDSHNDLAFRVRAVLDVVGRPLAAITHLHDRRLPIGGRCAGIVRLLALPLLDLGELR